MATLKQKRAFKIMTEKLTNDEPITMGQVLLGAGFSKSTSENPKIVTETKGWKELLAKIDDGKILKRVNEILDGKDNRTSLQAADMLLKLKDRYPAGKLKVTQFEEELNKYNE